MYFLIYIAYYQQIVYLCNVVKNLILIVMKSVKFYQKVWRACVTSGVRYVVHLERNDRLVLFVPCVNPWNGVYFSYCHTFESGEDFTDWIQNQRSCKVMYVREF